MAPQKEPAIAIIELRDVCKAFAKPTGEPLPVLRDITISITEGEILGLLGRSGSGKSTLLRIAGGLIAPTTGAVLYRGVPLAGRRGHRRGISGRWRPRRSRHYVNVVIAGKHPAPQWLTMETLAAVSIMREHLPDLKIRVINIVDLMKLQPSTEHPHGLTDMDFDDLFTKNKPVIFAFHGYPWLIHRLTYRRTNHDNIHVRGYKEEGTITTPFDMTVLNDLDRFHLVMDTIDRSGASSPVHWACAPWRIRCCDGTDISATTGIPQLTRPARHSEYRKNSP